MTVCQRDPKMYLSANEREPVDMETLHGETKMTYK